MKTKYFNEKKLLNNNLEIKKIIKSFKKGNLIAFPTETVYGLGADANNPEAIKKIYEVKKRPIDNPLILHIGNIEQLKKITKKISKIAFLLIKYFWPGPLTLVFKSKNKNLFDKAINLNGNIAIRMPRNLITEILLSQGDLLLAAPSANISGKPSPTSYKHVKEDLDGKIYGIIDGGKCEEGIESTILSLIDDEKPTILRPGVITKKMLENIIKKKITIDSFLQYNKNKKPIVPGMKYKHYAPNGKVYIFFSHNDIKKIKEIVTIEKISSNKIALLFFEEEKNNKKYKKLNISNYYFMGSKYNLKKVIHNFYSILRKCDKINIELLFIQGTRKIGLGFSFMNRLEKAADYNYINK